MATTRGVAGASCRRRRGRKRRVAAGVDAGPCEAAHHVADEKKSEQRNEKNKCADGQEHESCREDAGGVPSIAQVPEERPHDEARHGEREQHETRHERGTAEVEHVQITQAARHPAERDATAIG